MTNKSYIDARELPSAQIVSYFEQKIKLLITFDQFKIFCAEYPKRLPEHQGAGFKGGILIQKIELL